MWIAVFLCLMSSVAAQARPNFAGTWVEDVGARKTTLPSPPSGAKSMAMPETDTVVKQTDADVITERAFMSSVIRHVYHLDGRESVNKNGANTLTTRSTWEGQKLVTKGTSFSVTSAGEFLWQYKEVRSLDKSGALTIETTTTDEAGKTNVVTQVFRRK